MNGKDLLALCGRVINDEERITILVEGVPVELIKEMAHAVVFVYRGLDERNKADFEKGPLGVILATCLAVTMDVLKNIN